VLSRERFDAALAEAASDAGAVFLPNTSASLDPCDSQLRRVRLRCDGQEEHAAARLVLAATGLGGRLLAGENPNDSLQTAGSRVGAGAVTDAAPTFYHDAAVFMAYGEGGYVGLARREDGRLNVAAALAVDQLRTWHNPGVAAARILADVGWPSISELTDLPWRGTLPLSRCAERPSAERVLAIGDAAGYVEPFTGEGIGWALASAVALTPLAARGWDGSIGRAWAERHRRVVSERQGTCRLAARVLRHPHLARAVIGLL